MPKYITGGNKLNAFFRKAKAAKSHDVDIGFFESAKYPDGTPVAAVAAWNEFGTERIPERPFFRNAIRESKDELLQVLKGNVDPRTMNVDRRTAGLLGQTMVGIIQENITKLRTPPNRPATIAAKGSSNPLIDEGIMKNSATYRVEN